MSLPTMTALNQSSFPQGITTVGVEFEGYWERQGTPPEEPPDPEDCDHCTQDENGGWHYCDDCWVLHHPEENDYHSDQDERRQQDLKYDGSVACDENIDADAYVAGEAVSPILHNWAEVVEFTADRYPQQVDWKTGMHVHIGITQNLLNFSFAASYWSHLRGTLEDVGSHCGPQTNEWLDHRLRTGRSTPDADYYCGPNTYKSRYERYNAVNYTAFEDHGTLEVRVCPMAHRAGTLSAERQALSLIHGVLSATSEYWTSRQYWEQATGHINTEEDLTLITSELAPSPTSVTITC